MKLEDVVTMREWWTDYDPQAFDHASNIFSGKVFKLKEHDKGSEHGAEETAVSPAIKELLDFLLGYADLTVSMWINRELRIPRGYAIGMCKKKAHE